MRKRRQETLEEEKTEDTGRKRRQKTLGGREDTGRKRRRDMKTGSGSGPTSAQGLTPGTSIAQKEKVGRLPGTRIMSPAAKTRQRASITSWLSGGSGPKQGPKCTVGVSSCEPKVCQEKAAPEVACKPTLGPRGPSADDIQWLRRTRGS